MAHAGWIKNADELEFAIFCIGNIAAALHTDAATVYRALSDKNDILREYFYYFPQPAISPCCKAAIIRSVSPG